LLLVPNHGYMASKLEALAQAFLDSVYIGDYVPGGKPKTSGVKKREADADSSRPKKVAKIADVGDMNDIASRGKVSYSILSFSLMYFIYYKCKLYFVIQHNWKWYMWIWPEIAHLPVRYSDLSVAKGGQWYIISCRTTLNTFVFCHLIVFIISWDKLLYSLLISARILCYEWLYRNFFPHCDRLQICGCRDFASAVDTGNNCFMPE